jgi:hypothetical protein
MDILFVPEGLIASRLAPTGESVPNVGASLLAMVSTPQKIMSRNAKSPVTKDRALTCSLQLKTNSSF